MERHAQDPVTGGGAGTVPITGLFVNVQSLSANKWKEVKSAALRMQAAIVAAAEVWSDEKTPLQFMGYKRRASKHMGMGKGMVLWVREGLTVHMEKVHDDRWILAVIVTMTSHTVLVVTVHMPQRNDPGIYAQCLCMLHVLREMYACVTK